MKLREGLGRSGAKPSGPKLALLVLLIGTFILFLPFTGYGAKNTISFSTDGPALLATGELNGYGLGITRSRAGEYGLGFSLSQSLVPAPENWDYQPFLTGLLSAEDEPGWDTLSAGLMASYFDYRIGGWALSADSIAWVRRSSYGLSSTGSFTIGNIGLSYELGLSGAADGANFWFPPKQKTEFSQLYRESPGGFSNNRNDYLLFGGSKRLSLKEESLTWSQGVGLDLREESPDLELVADLNYLRNSATFLVSDLSLKRWSLQVKIGKLVLGYISPDGYLSGHGLRIGYRDDLKIDLELVTRNRKRDRVFNVALRW